MKKHLNLHISLTKASNAFESALQAEKKVLSGFRELIRGGPILWFKSTINLFVIEIEL